MSNMRVPIPNEKSGIQAQQKEKFAIGPYCDGENIIIECEGTHYKEILILEGEECIPGQLDTFLIGPAVEADAQYGTIEIHHEGKIGLYIPYSTEA